MVGISKDKAKETAPVNRKPKGLSFSEAMPWERRPVWLLSTATPCLLNSYCLSRALEGKTAF